MLPLKLYTLSEKTILKASLEEAWKFFSSPYNLPKITPPKMNFRILSNPPDKTYAGLIIHYRVTPLFGLNLQWVTEITHCVEGKMFVDEQRFGPYRLWHHQHLFEEHPEGVLMCDLVHYALYGDPISRPLHHFLVAPQLRAIFNYRSEALQTFFPGSRTIQSRAKPAEVMKSH